MSQQPISPAIIINENFEARPIIPDGYSVLCLGFTSEGVENEPFILRNIADFISFFGEPDPSRKEQIYAFESAKRIIESGANLVFIKIPYGDNEGFDVGEEYSALVYPVVKDSVSGEEMVTAYSTITQTEASSFGEVLSGQSPFSAGFDIGDVFELSAYELALTTLSSDETLSSFGDNFSESLSAYDTKGFIFGEPSRIELNSGDFDKLECGLIDWSDAYSSDFSSVNSFDSAAFGKAGMIIVDTGRSKTQDSREGYYITVTDNTDGDPATDWDSITGIKTTVDTTGNVTWTNLSTSSYEFSLTAPFTDSVPSVSQAVAALSEQNTSESWSNDRYINHLTITLWRLRKDVQNGSEKLIPVVVESHTGSLSEIEKIIVEGGFEKNVFLPDVVEGVSNRLKVFVNPNISESTFVDTDGRKILNTRMWRGDTSNVGNIPFTDSNKSDNMYSVSRFYLKEPTSSYAIGNLPKKINNALCTVDNPERVNIDLSVEAGLGTIWNVVKVKNLAQYDDEVFLDVIGDLGRSTPEGTETGDMRVNWREVYDIFLSFTEKTRVVNGGRHHLHIADPIRHILVNGRDCKVYDSKTKCRNPGVFQTEVYWPLKNLTKGISNTVSTIDAQWYKSSNVYSQKPVWIPSSPVTASLFAQTEFPWQAAAGVNRGLIRNVVDVAFDPVLRDRDYLFKINNNAVFFDRNFDGYLRYADRTMLKNDDHQLKENSARRLLVWLERNLQIAVRPFLFEQNNLQTRIRFKNTIEVYLNTLLQNGAIEDFSVSLKRNTLSTQQDGCLVADIGITITGIVNQIKLNLNLLRLDQNIQEVF